MAVKYILFGLIIGIAFSFAVQIYALIFDKQELFPLLFYTVEVDGVLVITTYSFFGIGPLAPIFLVAGTLGGWLTWVLKKRS